MKPYRYALRPDWQQTTEYHVCRFGNCQDQAAFVLLPCLSPAGTSRYPEPTEDAEIEIELVWLCPKHQADFEELRDALFQSWSRPEATERLNQWLGWVIRKPIT